jgi:hypothetical protein
MIHYNKYLNMNRTLILNGIAILNLKKSNHNEDNNDFIMIQNSESKSIGKMY